MITGIQWGLNVQLLDHALLICEHNIQKQGLICASASGGFLNVLFPAAIMHTFNEKETCIIYCSCCRIRDPIYLWVVESPHTDDMGVSHSAEFS